MEAKIYALVALTIFLAACNSTTPAPILNISTIEIPSTTIRFTSHNIDNFGIAMPIPSGTLEITCEADFYKIEHVNISFDGGLVVRRTIPCIYLDKAGQQQTISVAFFVENVALELSFLPIDFYGISIPKKGWTNAAIDNYIQKKMEILEISDKRLIYIWIGEDAEKLLRTKNPFRNTIKAGTALTKEIMAFAIAGDSNLLSNLSQNVLLTYRIRSYESTQPKPFTPTP